MSGFLVAGLLTFVGIASGVLLWEGLELRPVHGPRGSGHELRHARARLAAGAVGLAIVIWIASGILTRAW